MPALKHLVYSICLLHFNHLFTPFQPKFKVFLLSALLRKNVVFSCSLSETCSWYPTCTFIPNDFKSEYRIAFSSTEQWRSCSRLILNSIFYEKLPYSGSSSLACTLKDHLYQCPSKISEEMVRCMASIYYLLRTEAPEKPEKARSPFLSRSSTNVILPQRMNGDENSSSNSKCTVEIASISVDKNQMPDVSYAITHYRLVQNKILQIFTLR